jgi:putative ABC transport system permease protein
MDRLTLIAFLRGLARHRLHAVLNIGGLAVGLAVFLVLSLYVQFETSYETWLPHYRQIHLIEAQLDGDLSGKPNSRTPIALWSAIHADLPATLGTRLSPIGATVVHGGTGTSEPFAYVDPDFAKVFDLPVVQGELLHAFDNPSNAVVTQAIARRYFPGARAVGQTITVVFRGEKHVYRIAGVIADLPANTGLTMGILARMVIPQDKASDYFAPTHQWNYFQTLTYVRLPEGATPGTFAGQLDGVIRRHARAETPDNPAMVMTTRVQPIADVFFETPGTALAVHTLGIVGVLTLLIAVVNYVNLATARAGLRAREVAMRKVLGAARAALARQYIGEAVATTAIAAFFGLALAEAGLPLVNAAGGLSLSITYLGLEGVLLPLMALVLVVGTLAGIYPALVLSRVPAAAVLASARSPGGGKAGTRIREGLVIFQFTIAIAFVVGTMVLIAQTRHVRASDVGFERQGLILVPSMGNSSLNNAQRDTILHRFANLPGVTSVTMANKAPGPDNFQAQTSIDLPGHQGDGVSMMFYETTPGFFKLVGARLLAGRFFDLSHAGDINPNLDQPRGGDGLKPHSIIINRTAVTALHFASPQAAIGKVVGGGRNPLRTIIGVVEDMRFGDPRTPIPPEFYDFQPRDPFLAIGILRYSGDPRPVIDAARDVWRQEAPEVPFDAKTGTQSIETFYKQDDHAANLFTVGAVLAIAIGCVGLWGLASFNTARRIKEIGIRKTLGASSSQIAGLLVGQFLRPVLLANLFAWPLAFLAMRNWLAGFDDRIALSPLYFVGASALALSIATLTVLAQSLRAARAAPAWALRHE